MPKLEDLLKTAGIELSDEQAAQLPTLLEASDEVRSVVTAKNDLLDWKKTNTDKVAGYDTLQAEKLEAVEAKEQLAIEKGDYKAQIEARDEKIALQQATIDSRNKLAVQGSTESMTSEYSGLFNCSKTGAAFAKNTVKVEIDEQGQINKSFVVEGESFADIDAAKAHALTVPYLAAQMKAPGANGPDANGGSGGSGDGALKRSTMTADAKREYVDEHGQDAFLKLPRE